MTLTWILKKIRPHQEGVISEIYQRPEKSHFQEPPERQKYSECRHISAKVSTETG